ncbi:hypothetical protein KV100_09405 [Mumia sp. zg.B21]|uniref:hypothetical protein n=1 Tax=Mumia sp. zg.B21 TaxID=2855447 RepID=UPI001C6E5B1A|nr:hypothetical protein [Mumia sp. zg.B21]MBW9209876.1 hypothetical protein [Mumia sp. zg.B21]
MTTSTKTNATTTPSRALAWAALAAAAVQILVPAVQSLGGLGAPPSSQGEDLLITPAGYTFSIWSLIYLLTVVFAVVVLVKRSTGTRQPDRLLRDLVLLYAGAALWIVVSALEWTWVTAAVLVAMVVVAVDAATVAKRRVSSDVGAPTWLTLLARVTTGVYAGWVTAAGIVNVCAAMVESGWLDGDEVAWQLGALVVLALVALAISVLLGGSWAYAATLVWALIGVMVAVRDTSDALVLTAAAAAVVIVTVNAVLILRRRSSSSRVVSAT